MKYIITENRLYKIIDKYLTNQVFDGLHEVEIDQRPSSRFWMKNDEIVLDLDKKSYLRVNFKYWIEISKMFGLTNDETIDVVKTWVEKNLGLSDVNPYFSARMVNNPNYLEL